MNNAFPSSTPLAGDTMRVTRCPARSTNATPALHSDSTNTLLASNCRSQIGPANRGSGWGRNTSPSNLNKTFPAPNQIPPDRSSRKFPRSGGNSSPAPRFHTRNRPSW